MDDPIVPQKSSSWEEKLKNIVDQPEKEVDFYQVELVFRIADTLKSVRQPEKETKNILQVRPRFIDPKTGEKSMTILNWKDFGLYQSDRSSRYPLDPTTKNFLNLIVKTLGNDGNNKKYSKKTHIWLDITEESAEIIWPLIQGHQIHDVPLVFGEDPGFPISISKDYLVQTISITENKDDIQLEKIIVYENSDTPVIKDETYKLSLYGEKPLFALVNSQDPNPIFSFFPIKGKYDHDIFHSLEKPLQIDKKDIPKFIKNYLPILINKVETKTQTSKILITKKESPTLKIYLKKDGQHGISMRSVWCYGTEEIKTEDPFMPYRKIAGDKMIIRDQETEKTITQQINFLLNQYKPSLDKYHNEALYKIKLQKEKAVKFTNECLPRLAKIDGVEIIKSIDTPEFSIITEEVTTEIEVTKDGQQDWFDLNIKIKIGVHSIPIHQILPPLIAEENFFFLENGQIIDLRQPALKKLQTLLKQAAVFPDPESHSIQITRFQSTWFEELQKLGVTNHQTEEWQKAINDLRNATIPKINELESSLLKGTLRSYQKEGTTWLSFLRTNHLGGILADDMGLGKTIQSIALICRAIEETPLRSAEAQKSEGDQETRLPFLIIAPTSVIENWHLELEKFAPDLRVVVLRQGDRSEAYKEIVKAHVVVTSYALLHRDRDYLQQHQWDTIIIDEAQFVKNHQTKAYALIRQLRTSSRIALTGTPLENNLMELWSLFSITAPGLFPPPERFRETFQNPIEKLADKETLKQLRERIRPFILRRKKDLVEKDLPKKTEQIIFLEMEAPQQKIYDLFLQKQRQHILGLLAGSGFKTKRFEILTALMRLRQLCLHPALIDPQYRELPSVKIDTLMEHVENLIAEDHKVLIFSQFTSFLGLVRDRLDQNKITYCYLDGATKDRKTPVKEFQNNPEKKVFLISLKAGGVGLNLTAADYCIILDPWWNPAVENQAIARTHRIGQTKNVFVYKFIIKNSIEEKVLHLQEKKKRLFENILEEGEAFGSLITENDIRGLLD